MAWGAFPPAWCGDRKRTRRCGRSDRTNDAPDGHATRRTGGDVYGARLSGGARRCPLRMCARGRVRVCSSARTPANLVTPRRVSGTDATPLYRCTVRSARRVTHGRRSPGRGVRSSRPIGALVPSARRASFCRGSSIQALQPVRSLMAFSVPCAPARISCVAGGCPESTRCRWSRDRSRSNAAPTGMSQFEIYDSLNRPKCQLSPSVRRSA